MAPARGAPRGSLPTALLQLVPRDDEKAEIARLLLEDNARLVSLVGAPGAGKTRLAIIAASHVSSAFTDGVIFVDLSVVRDAAQVPAAIATAIGMREVTGERIAERVVGLLRKRNVLMVLDNFEHLLPAASMVTELIESCSDVRVLTTTREALHLMMERRFSVGPLSLPRPEHEGDLRLLEQVPSVALFCLRASSVSGKWALDARNAHAVAELCRRLDGLPLAIELAAAWTGVLSPRAVLGRLEQCLSAEISVAADKPERHRTLRAAIGWSYELLDRQEQAFFDRLAVFVDGWDEEAAAAVANIPVADALPVLASLTEKHMAWSEEQLVDGEPRFGLFDTLRVFAEMRLQNDDLGDARQRHAEHYLALAERAERALIGPDQRTWLDRLQRDLGNFRAALNWLVDTGQASLALRLAGALWFFWDMRGHLREGQQWLEAALKLPANADTRTERAAALNASGWLALVQHASYGQAIATLDEAREMAQQISNEELRVRAEGFLGLALALGTRDYTRADEVLGSAVEGARAVGDNWALALALYGQGHLALVQGDNDRCQDRWQTCAAVAQGVGNLYGLSYLQFRWGVIALLKSDLERANACLVESLRLSAELDSTREMAVAIAALVLVAAGGGQAQRAGRLSGAVQLLLERAGCDLPAFLRGEYDAGLAALRERTGSAPFQEWVTAGHSLPVGAVVSEALTQDRPPSHGPDSDPTLLPHTPLTAREWEIARHVARGSRNREIAEELVLAERTVGSHLERIFGRLHIRSRAQLATWVAERDASSQMHPSEQDQRQPLEGQTSGRTARRTTRQLRVVGE